MEKVIADYVSGLIPGEPQVCKNFAAIPLFHPADGSPYYLTLREALERGALTITEVGHEGSVPELKVINKGDTAVLLLDGEELVGAKQHPGRIALAIAKHPVGKHPVAIAQHPVREHPRGIREHPVRVRARAPVLCPCKTGRAVKKS